MAQPSEDRSPWWESSGDDLATAVTETIDTIREDQSERRANDTRHLRMYRNMALAGMGISSYARASSGAAPLSLNVARNMVNAVTSKMTKSRPKATFQTYGAGYVVRKQSRELDQFSEGMLYRERFREGAPRLMRDMGILGTCFVKVAPMGGGKICMERVFPCEMTIDSAEGMHGAPRNWYQSKFVDKRWLAARAKDETTKKRILELSYSAKGEEQPEDELFGVKNMSDMVRLDEAYHLASGPGEGDGKFVQSVQGVLLEDAPWKWDFAPYAVARWSESPIGFYGMGLCEELVGIQIEINRLVRKIQAAFQILSNPYILADRASNLSRGTITDIPGSIILYNGREPRVVAPSVVNAEVFSHLDRLYQRAYELAGISQMSAQSQKPVGFESGRAILVFEDIESDRFATVHREWENLHMRVVELGLWAAEQEKGYWAPAKSKLGLRKVKLTDIGIKREEVMMRIMPTSILGDTPAGQIDGIERLINKGIIQGPEDMADQIEDADLKSYLNRLAAPKRIVEKQIERMLEGGEYEAPESFFDLEKASMWGQAMYIEAREDGGYSKEAMANVRQYLTDLANLVLLKQQQPNTTAQAQPPAVPAAPPMPAAPGAAPPMPMPPPGAGMPPMQ